VFRKRAGVRYRKSGRELRAAVLTLEFESGAESGPKGIRTPDLMAASHNVLSGVLTSEYAGYGRAEWSLLWGVAFGEQCLDLSDRRGGDRDGVR